MTICIAAIAKEKDREYIVFSSDHMVSIASDQFEHNITKYCGINKNTFALLAGQPLLFSDLVEIKDIPNNKTIDEISFTDIAANIFCNFKNKRLDIIQKEILDVFNIDFNYVQNVLDKPIPNPFIHNILDQISRYRLNTSILLVGFDGDFAQICEINDANFVYFRDLNFHAIGSGQQHAINTLLSQKHSKENNICETIYNVYKAKRNSESALGVGQETDIIVLWKSKTATEINKYILKKDDIDILKRVYHDEITAGKTHAELKKLNVFCK